MPATLHSLRGGVTGKWILFADSDDYFVYCFNDILDKCYSVPDDVDIVYFNACSLDSDKYTNASRANALNGWIRSYEHGDKRGELMLRYQFGEPWSKLIRRSMIEAHHIRFEERSIHNDTAFSYLVGYYARKIQVCSKAIYCITYRPDSVSKQLDERKKLERIDNFASSAQFFKTHGIRVKVRWHFDQLYDCWTTNKDTYRKGVDILLKHGYSRHVIRKQLALKHLRRTLARTYFAFMGLLRR